MSAALPTAARELHGLAAYGWAFTAFLVANVVAMVASGQVSDARGPRPAAAGRRGLLRRRAGRRRHRHHDGAARRRPRGAGPRRRADDHRHLRRRRRGIPGGAAAATVRRDVVGVGGAVAGRPGRVRGARAARQLALGVPRAGAVLRRRRGPASRPRCARCPCRRPAAACHRPRCGCCAPWPSRPGSRRWSRPASIRRRGRSAVAVVGLAALVWGRARAAAGRHLPRCAPASPRRWRCARLLAGAFFGVEATVPLSLTAAARLQRDGRGAAAGVRGHQLGVRVVAAGPRRRRPRPARAGAVDPRRLRALRARGRG